MLIQVIKKLLLCSRVILKKSESTKILAIFKVKTSYRVNLKSTDNSGSLPILQECLRFPVESAELAITLHNNLKGFKKQ